MEAHWSHRSIAILKSSQAHIASSSIRSWSYCLGMILGACSVLSHFSHVRCFVTLWTVAHQTSLSMGFSRQKNWDGLAYPSPGDLPNPGIGPASLVSCTGGQVLFCFCFLPVAAPGKPNDSWFCPLNSWFHLFSPQVSLPSLYKKVPWVCSL